MDNLSVVTIVTFITYHIRINIVLILYYCMYYYTYFVSIKEFICVLMIV